MFYASFNFANIVPRPVRDSNSPLYLYFSINRPEINLLEYILCPTVFHKKKITSLNIGIYFIFIDIDEAIDLLKISEKILKTNKCSVIGQ